jgi:hypothetical protein
VRECLLIVLNEERDHRLYAERDLAALRARSSSHVPRLDRGEGSGS